MSAATPVLLGTASDAELSHELVRTLWEPPRKAWFALLAVSGMGALGLFTLVFYTFLRGIGVWGSNIPVAWAFAIINFVWWIGIGHAGTFISAILLLFEQRWRTSINRFAEAMTLFAVIQAGLVPLLPLGRAWVFFLLVPQSGPLHGLPELQ